jgi:hypothetical protein
VTSNFGCVGLDTTSQEEFEALIRGVVPATVRAGETDGVVAYRWTDESGARMTLGIRDNAVQDLVPSYDARPGVRLAGVRLLGDEVVGADVLDEHGTMVTRMACELEQWRCLGDEPVDGLAAVTAFGLQVEVLADAEAFRQSPMSLLNPEDEGRARPADLDPQLTWPLRTATESFVSYGLFSGGDGRPHAHAQISGVVLSGSTKLNSCTGKAFHVARVRSLIGELDVCLTVAEQPEVPVPGNVVAGIVYLVASIDQLWTGEPELPPAARPKRRWFSR